MKLARLMMVVLAVAGQALAQGACKQDIALNRFGQPAAGAIIRVCTQGATGTPCNSLAPIFRDAALTNPITGSVFNADQFGNYAYCATAGYYKEQATYQGVTFTKTDVTFSGPNSTTGINAQQIQGKAVDTPAGLGAQATFNGTKVIWQLKPFYDARDFGMLCDSLTDNTAAINTALTTMCPSANALGGTLVLPDSRGGSCKALGRIVIPTYGGNEATSVPGQTCTLRIVGQGALMNGASNPIVPNSGTVLDLRYSAGNSKIVSLGMGHLTINDLTMADFGGDSTWFGLSTNTTVHLDRVGFYGTGPGTGVTNDAWHFGGTDIAHVLTENAHFAGYGTAVTNSWFNNIQRAIYGGAYANGIVITGNNIWNSSGNATGGAIEFYGDAGSPDVGNYIFGNIFEMASYKYAVYGSHFGGNFLSNDGYDSTATTSAFYRMENSSVPNTIIASQHDDAKPFVTTDASSTRVGGVLNTHQSQMSTWTEPWTFTNTLSLSSVERFLNTDAEYWELQPIFGAGPQLRFNHHSNAGVDTLPFQVSLSAGVNTELSMLGVGTINNVTTLNSIGGFVINPAAGSSFFPLGVAAGVHFDVNTHNLIGVNAENPNSITVNTGMSQGGGFKHQRFAGVLGGTCPTAAAVGATCTSATKSWSTAFADANYTVSCTVVGGITGQPHVVQIASKLAASITLQIAADTAAAADVAAAGEVDCIAVHD